MEAGIAAHVSNSKAIRPRSLPRLRSPIRTRSVQIDQNIARLGAFARADNPAILQFVHDAGGPSVPEAQPALH
jgi:hypothetical protein